ncbi:MAG: hypothetical protein DMF59_07925 [Acidobacteria bacterium]|nr:MAG: hypothetical protein DMF59_07925 [Acidobacteriota bacterium]
MLLIRNVFQCKPGQAKTLVKMFKETMAKAEMARARVLTDVASTFWTVVFEVETESLGAWEQEFERMTDGGLHGSRREWAPRDLQDRVIGDAGS